MYIFSLDKFIVKDESLEFDKFEERQYVAIIYNKNKWLRIWKSLEKFGKYIRIKNESLEDATIL